jgi:murein DD-endopeptidase MepM/ murein hydrolase activator NlpD
MPTVSGRVGSALFGLVRTSSSGGPAFHEGIDIAPVARDRQGQPTDSVFAVAEGTVGYVNRVAGNSNYGLYVVIVHVEPVGEFYTLYAHLARVEPAIRAGTVVRMGDTLGQMGHTPAGILPAARGHLHFEIGLIQNSRFDRWYRAQKLTPDHGLFNGQNFVGIDPQTIYREWNRDHRFAVLEHLRSAPPAFTLLVAARQPINFFTRYPALWQGEAFRPGVVVLDVAEGGVPIAGRMATDAELAAAGTRRPPLVLQVSTDPTLPARRLVTRGRDNTWRLSASGTKWLEILLY